ncbi:MAG: hypothetical protein EOO65_04905 [Methanosarcinales archaeon]|nr:MAG: hypothetical protein EOO65_04905 [Methanosarcinales archaeon]
MVATILIGSLMVLASVPMAHRLLSISLANVLFHLAWNLVAFFSAKSANMTLFLFFYAVRFAFKHVTLAHLRDDAKYKVVIVPLMVFTIMSVFAGFAGSDIFLKRGVWILSSYMVELGKGIESYWGSHRGAQAAIIIYGLVAAVVMGGSLSKGFSSAQNFLVNFPAASQQMRYVMTSLFVACAHYHTGHRVRTRTCVRLPCSACRFLKYSS